MAQMWGVVACVASGVPPLPSESATQKLNDVTMASLWQPLTQPTLT